MTLMMMMATAPGPGPWQQRPSLAADCSDMSRGVRTYHAEK